MTASRILAAALAALSTASVFLLPGSDGNAVPRPDASARQADVMAGGQTTYTGPVDARAFSHPAANLDAAQRLDFQVGKALFERLWVSAPASTEAADGLGPLFNARACIHCHVADGRGHAPEGPDDDATTLFLRLSVPPTTRKQFDALASGRINTVPDPIYGHQLQDRAIQGHRAEGRLRVDYEPRPVALADGSVVTLRRPRYRIEDLAYGPLHPETRISPRLAPPMIGLGLLAAIPEARILALADAEDANGDGISGRANRVWSHTHQRVMLGRFGLKAGSPTVDEQSQAAFAHDIGIAVPLHPADAGDCTERQPACLQAIHGNSPQYDDLEAHRAVTDLVAHYAEGLAVPARRDVTAPAVLEGQRLFHRAGCAACHVPAHRTGEIPGKPHLSHQRIGPYTDLLLHDMGKGLADDSPEGLASGREWRTAPLWGLGLTATVGGRENYLHDGRARTLLEAILWHGGEAEAARAAVIAMNGIERARLLRFLESL